MNNYIQILDSSFSANSTDNVMNSLFHEYEYVIVESLITSFGLDFLINDQHGGDVDTIHNVRQIDKDDQMTYKSKKNKAAYDNKGAYDSYDYHRHSKYKEKNREISKAKKEGTLIDAYTLDPVSPNDKTDLDHVISAKEIHEDRARVLANLNGTDLANAQENLQATNRHTNRSKKADSMDTYLQKHGDEYSDQQTANMKKKDSIARKSYEAKLAKAYYTSASFAKDLTCASGKKSFQMGTRQALGFIFAEMYFCIKEELEKLNNGLNYKLTDFLETIGTGIKKGYKSAKEKYADLFSKFLNGSIAGALSSLTTTLCNIFITTTKNIVQIIRQVYPSLTEAVKVLFINPDNYLFGERMRSVAKIIATAGSIVSGILVNEAISKTALHSIPEVGEIVEAFCGSFVTGIMSCSLLFFLDQDETINRLVTSLNGLHTVETEVNYYREQAKLLDIYSAELTNIDLDTFYYETNIYNSLRQKLETTKDEAELLVVLENAMNKIGIISPWGKHDFDDFMQNKELSLVFQ